MEGIEILITTENAAFEDSPATELARILHKLAECFERDGIPPYRLRDINGNTCGTVKVRQLSRR
jgi:hypothetical protein